MFSNEMPNPTPLRSTIPPHRVWSPFLRNGRAPQKSVVEWSTLENASYGRSVFAGSPATHRPHSNGHGLRASKKSMATGGIGLFDLALVGGERFRGGMRAK